MIRPLMATACLLLAVFVTVDSIAAQVNGLPFRRKENNRQTTNSVEVNQSHGPWMIMCASFADEEGLQQAKALVQELRQKYRLRAYIHAQHFDFTRTSLGGWKKHDTAHGPELKRRRMTTKPNARYDEYAVVVGDFASPDDAWAQKILEQIKYIKPDSLTVSESVSTNQRMGAWREFQKTLSTNAAMREKGPMRAAFIMPNPTLPDDYFVREGMDPFVEKMNKGVQYSLLKCSKPYSVKVATFRGDSTFKANEMELAKRDLEQRQRFNQPVTESKLAEAAAKAHLLTQELRRNGIEAYEFHDRNESFVCVGSFDWATRKLSNGKDELNPEIAKVIKKYKARVDSVGGMRGAVRPKSISSLAGKGIFFDVQPIPVMIPKAPKRGLLSKNR